MKAILRLKGKIRPEKQRSVISYEQSEKSRHLSVVSYQPSALRLWKLIKYCALDNAYADRKIGVGHERCISVRTFHVLIKCN